MKRGSYNNAQGRRALQKAFFASQFAPCQTHQNTFRVTYLPTGQPTIVGSPCHASIAHTKGWAVGAIAKHTVGVDVEHIRRRIYEKELLRYIASPHEQIRAHLRMTEPSRALTLLWVIKESVRKCLGVKRPVMPKELVILRRAGKFFFVRWQKHNATYKAYIQEHGNTIIGRAFPAHNTEHITLHITHTHANIHI